MPEESKTPFNTPFKEQGKAVGAGIVSGVAAGYVAVSDGAVTWPEGYGIFGAVVLAYFAVFGIKNADPA